jgi:hypothetical protein
MGLYMVLGILYLFLVVRSIIEGPEALVQRLQAPKLEHNEVLV